MDLPLNGGCVCGAVRYEVTTAPLTMFRCHCRDCQQSTGGAFLPGVLVSSLAFRLTKGELKYHHTPSLAGGRHKRGFCAECGSRITGGEFDERPGNTIGLAVGSFDDSTWFQPQMDIFVGDAQPWNQIDPSVPKFDQYPPKR